MERRLIRVTSWVAIAIVLATAVAYVLVIRSQGESEQPYIARFVVGYMAVMAALIGFAMLSRSEIAAVRVPMRAAAASGLLVLGFLAAFSIGIPLIVAGVLVIVAFSRTARPARTRPARLSALVAVAVTVVLAIAGLDVAQRLVVCPGTGSSGGGGFGIILGSYQYDCTNGNLDFHST